MERADEYAGEVLGRASRAAEEFRDFDQERVDRVVRAVFEAAYRARIELARLAHEETGMGLFEHKVIKNAWASLLVYEDIRHRKTVGVVGQDLAAGITEVAQPKGPILATIPVTNPTSTTIFKALICLKTRNPVIFTSHRGARRSVRATVRILAQAAESAGSPAQVIQWMTHAQTEYLEAVMRHPRLALILATGTTGIVRTAQASGTPTLGVGSGNVPVYVHSSADLSFAARAIVHSKTFDNGTVCASEQALVAEADVAAQLNPLIQARGAYFCSPEEMRALGPVCFDLERRRMRSDVVGQSAAVIAERAGFRVPPGIRLLVAEPDGVGPDHPLSHEILAPVLAEYRCKDYPAALAVCQAVSRQGGVGHTVGVYANDEAVVSDFAGMNAARILVNQPSTEGAIGGIYNSLRPSLTLACGTGAGNLSTDNISIEHLLDIHRVARLRPNSRWIDTPRETWLDPAIGPDEILRIYSRND
jgi:acetaldehyde dehydrogenase / alcohol dehydrogenase